MKNIFKPALSVFLLIYVNAAFCNYLRAETSTASPGPVTSDSINILSSDELHGLVTIWTNEYSILNPDLKFKINGFDPGEIVRPNTLSFITNNESEKMPVGSAWKMVVGHSAFIPVFNSGNPAAEIIANQGITTDDIRRILSGKTKWSEIINGGPDVPVQFYLINDDELKSGIEKFCNSGISDASFVKTIRDDEFISAIQNDIYSIGFCRMQDLREPATNKMHADMRLMPVDKNSNGRIDNFENIYADPDHLTRGIWLGKYPHVLCNNVVAVLKEKPADENLNSFLFWIMNSGGQFMESAGFTYLANSEKEAGIAALTGGRIITSQAKEPFIAGIWIFLLSGLVITGLLTFLLFGIMGKKKEILMQQTVPFVNPFNETTIVAPRGIYFDKSHTWSFMEKDGNVRVGIDDFLQHVTGTLTKIRLKEPGEYVRRGEKILTVIRNGKQLNLHSPVSGLIREHNHLLSEDSSQVNRAPFSEGWVYLIEPGKWEREIQFMFMSGKYREWIKDEIIRLKDFFSAAVIHNNPAYAHVVMQDGGEVADNVLADLEPEVWEDFQTNFIDTSK